MAASGRTGGAVVDHERGRVDDQHRLAGPERRRQAPTPDGSSERRWPDGRPGRARPPARRLCRRVQIRQAPRSGRRHRLPLCRLRRGSLTVVTSGAGHPRSRVVYPRVVQAIESKPRAYGSGSYIALYGSAFALRGSAGQAAAPRGLRRHEPHPMQFVDVIARKRDGQALPREAIDQFVEGVVRGSYPRLPGVRPADGDRAARHDRRRDRLADRRHGAVRRPDRPVGHAGCQSGQAQHGRRRRQGVDRPGAGGRRLRRDRAEDVGPRPRAYRRARSTSSSRSPASASTSPSTSSSRPCARSAPASSARPRRWCRPTRSSTRCATSRRRSRASR